MSITLTVMLQTSDVGEQSRTACPDKVSFKLLTQTIEGRVSDKSGIDKGIRVCAHGNKLHPSSWLPGP